MSRTTQFGDIYQRKDDGNYIILGVMLSSPRREWHYPTDFLAVQGFIECPEEIGYTFICNQDDVTIVPREWRVGDIVDGVIRPRLITNVSDNEICSVFIDAESGYTVFYWFRNEFDGEFTFIENQDDIVLPTKKTCCKEEERYESGELPAVGDIIEAVFTWVVVDVDPFTKVSLWGIDHTPASKNPPNFYTYIQRYDESVSHYPQIGDIYQNSIVENSNTYRLVVSVTKNRTKTLVLTDNDVYMAPWSWFTSDLVAEKNNRFICNQEELEPVFDESLIIPGAIVEWKAEYEKSHSFWVVVETDDKAIWVIDLETNEKGLMCVPDFKEGRAKYIQHTNDNI